MKILARIISSVMGLILLACFPAWVVFGAFFGLPISIQDTTSLIGTVSPASFEEGAAGIVLKEYPKTYILIMSSRLNHSELKRYFQTQSEPRIIITIKKSDHEALLKKSNTSGIIAGFGIKFETNETLVDPTEAINNLNRMMHAISKVLAIPLIWFAGLIGVSIYRNIRKRSQSAQILHGDQPVYGGFWVRLAAGGIDALFLTPFIVFFYWSLDKSQSMFVIANIMMPLLFVFYEFYLVKRYGGTFGKLIIGLRIRKVDMSPVGYKEAFLRCLPYFVDCLLVSAALLLYVLSINPDDFQSISFMDKVVGMQEYVPWSEWVDTFYTVFVLAEAIVLLANSKKRAIHDFLAGTVVVKV